MPKPSVEYFRELLSSLFKDRKCILAVGSLADSLGLMRLLYDLGGQRRSGGTGPYNNHVVTHCYLLGLDLCTAS